MASWHVQIFLNYSSYSHNMLQNICNVCIDFLQRGILFREPSAQHAYFKPLTLSIDCNYCNLHLPSS